ncbi:hypothetical protein [Mucilaginibacter paludis]|uniref:Fibronectin type-III domain-containing protein n=1 Tax=Mucilaginibacter paludis DSM 18603 TaxID=714943 RepID=H1Y6T7_9SPHI|nr:hypothetical protein [Mucilaginibacter paludis]EHQ26879.1 hypothetical protein Mucpa_2767 [Mucilaginibacter paludis DSM 18603]
MKKLLFVSLVFILLLAGCGKKDVSDNTPTGLPPLTSTLVFPAQNALCISGSVISAGQSSIAFKWTAAENADSYDITIKNLLTGLITTQTVNQPQADVVLLRNTPYSWFITSKSTKSSSTAKSDVWKFYNSGSGVIAYAPFPADNLIPALGQTISSTNNKVTLSWTGSDIDNDIASYDVYFGTLSVPTLYKKDITTASVDVSVTPATKYYWKVITKDAVGNTSESDVIQFTVN